MVARRGLVLGGGGVLGAAWTIGALRALEGQLGLDVRRFDHIAGTSAGAVLTALLGTGLTPNQLREHQLGTLTDGPLADLGWDHDNSTGGSRPGRPKLGVGSLGLVARNVRRLRRLPPTAVLSAFVPEGRGSLDAVHRLVEAVTSDGGWPSHPELDGGWPSHPELRIIAMNYETGRRVPFNRRTSPPASLADAVTASCAIPGWFAPVTIDGHRYVDGGACSATSVDVLAGLGLDEVYVLAPMVSVAVDRPASWMGKLERQWRARTTKRCWHEVAKLRAEGTKVTVLGPGPEDLRAFGGNVMDVSRRIQVLETAERTTEWALQRLPAGQWAEAG